MANTEKVVSKDPAEKLAFKRLSVLQLAEALGSVTEACRHGGMDRTSFYAWKKRFVFVNLVWTMWMRKSSGSTRMHVFAMPTKRRAVCSAIAAASCCN